MQTITYVRNRTFLAKSEHPHRADNFRRCFRWQRADFNRHHHILTIRILMANNQTATAYLVSFVRFFLKFATVFWVNQRSSECPNPPSSLYIFSVGNYRHPFTLCEKSMGSTPEPRHLGHKTRGRWTWLCSVEDGRANYDSELIDFF